MIDQELEQKKQAALDAGATLEEVEMIAPGSPGVEGVDYQVGSEEDALAIEASMIEDLPDLESYQLEIPTTWPNEAASEKAAYVAAASGGDPAIYDKVKDDLTRSGRSELADATQASIEEQQTQIAIQAASEILRSPDVSDAEKTQVIKNLQEQTQSNRYIDIANEMTLRLNDAAEANATSANDEQIARYNFQPMSERLQYDAMIRGVIAEAADNAFTWSAGTVLDVLGSFVSVNDSVSYAELLNHLEIEWDGVETLAPGEMMKQVQRFAQNKSPKEKYELALNLQEFLRENAGVLGANEVQAVNMMSSIFNTSLGADPDAFDWDRWLMDAGPTLDLMSFGLFSFIRDAVTAPIKAAKSSRMARATAANPDAAAEMAAAAVKDAKQAEMLGETADQLTMKHAVPKLEGWKDAQTPPKVTEAIKRSEDELAILKEADINEEVIVKSRGKTEATKMQEEITETARGHSHWLADTEVIAQPGKPWKVNALIGKNGGYGFAKKDDALEVLNTVYGGEGRILTRSNRIDALEEVVEKGQELQSARKQVIQELESAKAPKLTRGEEKALRKELKDLKAEIAKRTPQATTAGGTKASRLKQAEEVQTAKRDIEPLQREVNEIEGLLDQSKQGARAEANISRLQQEQYGKLDGDVKARLDELMEDRLIQAAKPAEENIEYFIKVERSGDIKFDDKDVVVSLGAEKGSWFFDSATKLTKELSQMGNAVFDKWKYLEKEMLRYLDPMAKLSREDQIKVSRLLTYGNEREHVFSIAEMRRYHDIKDKKVMLAYKSFRKAMDIAFTLENRVFRRSLEADGMMHVKASKYEGFAKPLAKGEAMEVKRAYDPVTDTIHTVNPAELYKGGEQIGRLRRTYMKNDIGTNYILLKNTTVGGLPQQVLNKRVGWLPQTNKSNYFITKTKTVEIDGTSVEKEFTVKVAHNLKDAERQIKGLEETALEGEKFGFKHDRALTSQDRDYAEHMGDIYATTGGLFYSKRGERLTDLMGNESIIKDPLEAAVSAITRVSRDVTMKPYVDDMKVRFIQTYNHLLGEKKNRFPTSANDIHAVDKVGDPQVVQAKAMFRHIEILEGLGTNAGWRKNSIIVADYIERNFSGKKFGKLTDAVANVVRAQADSDPVGWVRARNFELNLATNPLAQLLVQPSQTLNMFALGPKTFVQDFRRGRLISKLATRRADVLRSDAELAQSAKTLGMTVDELRADIRSFRRSGANAAVTSHETARDAVTPLSRSLSESAIQRGTGRVAQLYRTPVSFLGKGFERGEEINIGVHWQVAKRRWMQRNEGKSPYTPEAEYEIAGEARNLSLAMTQVGDFSYQRGIWAIPTQYLAVQHKQLLLMTTSQTLTRAEKFKVAGVQLAAWGPAGLSLGALISDAASDAGINMNEGLANVINDGLVEWSINNALTLINQDEVDLDLSSRFAAASGLNDNIVTAIAEMMVDGETADVWSIVFGPTASNVNRFYDAANTVKTIYNADVSAYQQTTISIDALLSVFSSYNNATKAAIYNNLGWWTDGKGNKLFQPSEFELIAKGLLGIQPNKLDDYYKVKRSQTEYDREIREITDDYYKHVNNLVDNALDDYEAGMFKETRAAFDAQLKVHSAIINQHGEDADLIKLQLQRKISNNIDKNGFDELTRNLQKLALQNGRSSNAESIINEAISAGFITPEQKDTYVEFTNTLMGEE